MHTPRLLLAPMEGVADRAFRCAIHSIGGFDEAVREFISVPANAHVESLAKVYDPLELAPTPLIPQIMGSEPQLMAAMALELHKRGAKRIDINCGCPSNTVTGRGAGSSLLKNTDSLHLMVKTVVQSSPIPVSVKMRSGYQDTSLFQENILAVQESGAAFITLHPRTKLDGYTAPANWELIALAKATLKIPVIGNGDINSVADAIRMLAETHCDALMIGRGAVKNPFFFHAIRSHFTQKEYSPTPEQLQAYLKKFLSLLSKEPPERSRINKLKQLLSFLFSSNPTLLAQRSFMLRMQPSDANHFLNELLSTISDGFFEKNANSLV